MNNLLLRGVRNALLIEAAAVVLIIGYRYFH